MPPDTGVQISHGDLTPEALRGVLEELVTRDGTEFSEVERKLEQVRRLLDRGEAQLWFDPATRTCSLRGHR